LVYAELQLTSKAGFASTTSLSSGKLSKNNSKVFDPFDDDFDLERGVGSQTNSSQTTASTSSSVFDDEFAASTSQSQSSLALSAGN